MINLHLKESFFKVLNFTAIKNQFSYDSILENSNFLRDESFDNVPKIFQETTNE